MPGREPAAEACRRPPAPPRPGGRLAPGPGRPPRLIARRTELSELAVEAGGTRLVLRKPSAIARRSSRPPVADPATGATATRRRRSSPRGRCRRQPAQHQGAADRRLVRLAGAGFGAVRAVGREVAVGQVVGLIEAMKLFNEIKSDLAGRVVRVVPESGALVKAKQPLIEVEPL